MTRGVYRWQHLHHVSGPPNPPTIDRMTLRFRDHDLERAFLADFFEHLRTPIRIAFALGVVMWVLWGLVVRRFLVDERDLDLAIRYLGFIPLLLVAAGLTLLPSWRRWWQVEAVGVIVLTGAASFVVLGTIASYTLERSTRLLFLRERQLDRERSRSDTLLLNVLPRAIVDRLKARGFDAIADRCGLEKIKTVGDAYMAVAGAPEPRADHAEAAAEMALGVQEALTSVCWPSGDPIRARVGLASGPAVAAVIGQRKFAYDLWGDTVNLASRLEAYGEPRAHPDLASHGRSPRG